MRSFRPLLPAPKVTPATAATEAVTPACLALSARNLIRRGEDQHLIEVQAGTVRLCPLGSWMFGATMIRQHGLSGRTCSGRPATAPCSAVMRLSSMLVTPWIPPGPGTG